MEAPRTKGMYGIYVLATDGPSVYDCLIQELREELCTEYDEEHRARAWTAAADAVKTYHDELINRWNQEMDTLLVYVCVHS